MTDYFKSEGLEQVLQKAMQENPEHQLQDLLATDLAEAGNIGIYGSPTWEPVPLL